MQKSIDLDHLERAQPTDPFADGLLDIDRAELAQHETGRLATHGDLGSKAIRVAITARG